MTAIFHLFTHLISDHQQERTYNCKCCCDLSLKATMAHVSGERAPAFTAEELDKLVDGILPQYTLLYGPPDKQHHMAEEKRGAGSHKAQEGETTEGEGTSGTEDEGSSTTERGGDTSDSDSSSDVSSLVVADTSVPTPTTGTAATTPTSTALTAVPQRVSRGRSPRRVGISFAPGTSGPAPVSPAALSEEAIELLRSLTVGQSTNLNAIQGVERHLQQTNAYLEGVHSGVAAQQRAFQALASALMAAIVPVSTLRPPTSNTQTVGKYHLAWHVTPIFTVCMFVFAYVSLRSC
ncbi:hypothetical protein NDU88_009040 [Pleurodeles waltl]|uniref:Transmembrane protein n=1 Tax=Pleurodeles waltl TaxID=8319 RepID=A0AAV7PUS6_PLEWA|nr:hypothetical protein NDU88_009040 [Pleurodeles waltl]